MIKNTGLLSKLNQHTEKLNCITHSDGKFPEIFTGGKFPESFRNLSGKFPETFPTMFAHRFLVAYFLTVLSKLPSFYDVTLHYL
jgi:hypothetical protein